MMNSWGWCSMATICIWLIILVGFIHIGFMILESFLWTKPIGLKIFRQSPETAALTRVLALNMGLYNGFLAAGLFWSAMAGNIIIASFFLICVTVAGIVGALTASRNIFFVQALPAMLALLFTTGILL